MNQKIIAFLGLLFLLQGIPRSAKAQDSYTFGNNIMFETVTTDKRFMLRQPAIYLASDSNVDSYLDYLEPAWHVTGVDRDVVPKSRIMLGVKLNPALKDYYSSQVGSIFKYYSAYFIEDSSSAELIALGITPANIKDYRYHIVQDDSVELVSWSSVTSLEKKYGAKRPYAFLGKFRSPGHQVMIEVVNKKDYGIRDGIIFQWKTDYKPRIEQLVVLKPNNIYFNINYTKINSQYATRFDSLSGLPMDFRFPVDSVQHFGLFFRQHETVPYSIYLAKDIDGKRDTAVVEYIFTGNQYIFGAKWFDRPGKYELLIHRAMDPAWVKEPEKLHIPFEVLPPPPLIEKKISIKQLLPYILGAIAFIATVFIIYYRLSKRRLRRAQQQGEMIGLQLRSIRAQLNPHFMFNALAAIQGLMNRNDLSGANHYLAKFADLTRQVLRTDEADMISLEDEMRMLDDYLQMEQLRFGFQYAFQADPAINLANTEIPVMLLQPFVENAVKHGVASLHRQGMIIVSLQQEEQNLVLRIKDNGQGFGQPRHDQDPSRGNGLGLRLSARRIVLLNQKYKTPWVSLDINSGAGGTIVTIILVIS